ncbi:MAG: four helix bundle protein [Candidatus Udaeobacter sp.]
MKKFRNPNVEYRNKFESPQSKGIVLMRNDDSKPYDLEERTFEFAKASRTFVKRLQRTIANIEDAKQFIRASGSIGANYIEANESIGKKDFMMKIKTCRREAKESGYWVRLLDCEGELEPARAKLLAEARELMNIFGAIVRKSEQ